jgi:hypothetical protein
MLAVAMVYAGLVFDLMGLVCLWKPLALIGLTARWHGVWLLAAGGLLSLLGANLPAKEIRVATNRTDLDQFVHVYQFSEFHTIRVNAPRDRVYAAIKNLKADEIFLFHTLTTIRRFGRPGPESILNAPETIPILEVATRTSFMVLSESPGQELVIGTTVMHPPGAHAPQTPTDFRSVTQPGFAIAAMNFRLEDASEGETSVSTETRVYATDASSRRRFAVYWRTIYPGSALIRRMWLRAIKKRAEASS